MLMDNVFNKREFARFALIDYDHPCIWKYKDYTWNTKADCYR